MLIEILILILAFPTGFLIAYWANDELVFGRKWFLILMALAAIGAIWNSLQGERIIVLSCGFILIVGAISFWKSFDKKWIKRRI